MVKCAVPGCKNDSRKQIKRNANISFHRFPKSREIIEAWVNAIKRPNWEPNIRSFVCSIHFNASSISETKKGLRKLVRNAIPVLYLELYASFGIILLHYAYGNLYSVFSWMSTSLDGEGNNVVITAEQKHRIVTAVIISAAAGQFSCGFLADHIGRKKVLCASALPGILGCLLLQSATEFGQIITATAAIGLTSAGLTLGQVYIAEISSSKYRGLLISLTLAATALGNTVGVIAAATLESSWRKLVSYDLAFMTILLLTSLVIPESPVWLASKQHFVQCGMNLSWLRGGKDSSLECEELLEKQLNMCSKLKNMQPNTVLICDGSYKTILKSLCISFACVLILEANGKIALYKFGEEFFSQVKGFKDKITYFPAIISVIDLTAICLSCVLILNCNRKTLLLSSGILTALSSALFSITSYYILSGHLKSSLLFIPFGSLILYMFFINLGLVPVVYTINRELFPIFYRGAGLSISSLGNCLIMLSVLKLFPGIFESCSLYGLFAIDNIVLLLAFSFLYCYCPETNGRTLKEIDDMFENDNGALRTDDSRLAYHTLPNDSLARNILWSIDR